MSVAERSGLGVRNRGVKAGPKPSIMSLPRRHKSAPKSPSSGDSGERRPERG